MLYSFWFSSKFPCYTFIHNYISNIYQQKAIKLVCPFLKLKNLSHPSYYLKGYLCKFLQKNLFWAVWKMFRKVFMDYEVNFEAWNKTIFKGMKNNIFLTCFSCSTIFLSIDDINESLVGANFRYLRTLESGIDVAPWIKVASGKFDKKNKHNPLKCANLCSKI